LDETLIHCNESSDIPSDVVLPIKFPHGEIIEVIFIFSNNILTHNSGWNKY